MAIKPLPTPEVLRQLFDYSPETGDLTWRHRPREHFANKQAFGAWNSKYAGAKVKAEASGGYLSARIQGKAFLAHRIIWVMQTGEQPPEIIDHINGQITDNRWCNLRAATVSQNVRNRRICSRNTSGFKGVSRDNVHWRATIFADGRSHYLGNFKTAEEAHQAYCKASAELHGEYGCTG